MTGVSPGAEQEQQAALWAGLSPEGRRKFANLERVAAIFLGGPPTPPDKWPRNAPPPPNPSPPDPPSPPPDVVFDPELDPGMPRVAAMACSEAPDVCVATAYKSTELDDVFAPGVDFEIRRQIRVFSYTPAGGGESRWSTQ